MKLKKVFMILSAISVFSMIGNEAKATYPVLSRKVEHMGFFGAGIVRVTLATFTVGNQNVTGYDVKCSGSGWTSCPKLGAEYRPAYTDNWDDVQIEKTDYLSMYALDNIADGNYEGSATIQVQVEGEETLRVYTVIWSSDDETGTNCELTVYRNDV